MILVGVDPSYTRSGVVMLDTDRKIIKRFSYGDTIGNKTFTNLYQAAVDRVTFIKGELEKWSSPIDAIISETPPPSGNFGSGLFGLDFLLFNMYHAKTDSVFGVAPTYVGHIHGTRKYNKSKSVVLAKEIWEIFLDNGYKEECKGRFSNDEAEALLFLVRLYVSYNNELAGVLLKKYPQFKDKKEFIV